MKHDTKKHARSDLFARIAAQHTPEPQRGLIEPQPPELPRRFLPAERSNPKAAFRPLSKLDTAAKLRAALVGERKRVVPFLRNLAPVPKSARLVAPI